MKIIPTNWGSILWGFVGDYCCDTFKMRVEKDDIFIRTTSVDNEEVYLGDIGIEFCPFCGKKIIVERVMQ